MKLKKIISCMVAVVMVLSSMVVFADTPATVEEEMKVLASELEAVVSEFIGTTDKMVVEGDFISKTENQITIKNGEEDFVVNVGEDTIYMNADASTTTMDTVKENTVLKIVVSEATTMSLPPQSTGYIVMVAEKTEESPNFPLFVQVKNVATDDNGNTVIASADGKYEIVPNAETEIVPFMSRKIVTLTDIKVDTEMLVYSNAMTMSLPAIVNPTKIMIFEPTVPVVEETETTEPEVADTAIPNKVIVTGFFVSAEDSQMTMQDGEDFIVNTDENTVVIKADGTPTTIAEIEKDSILKVIASSAMTMSIPAQSYGYVVMVADPGTETPVFPEYVEVETISVDENDNKVIASADGYFEVVPNAETIFEPYKTKNIVTVEDVKYGTEMLVYSDIATMSIPAVVNPTKVIILPEKAATDLESVIVNGEYVEVKVIKDETGYKVPVRFIAEAMGLEVGWDGNLNKVTVGTEPMGVNFSIGTNEYNKARMTPFTLSAEPVLIESRTYVPVDFFTEILEAKVKVVDGTYSFTR